MRNYEGTILVENSLVIWDHQKLPECISKDVLLWQSYDSQEKFLSIPNYLEKHAERFRVKYLSFIHELGEHRLKGKRIIDHLDIGDGFSVWWMTLIAGKNPFKSQSIYDCLRLIALEEILKEKALPEVKLFSDNNDLGLALQKLCENLQINYSREILCHNQNTRLSIRKIFYALPQTIQAIIQFIRFVTVRWPLQKPDKPAWHTGESVFFFALISFTLTQNYVIKDIFIQNNGKLCQR